MESVILRSRVEQDGTLKGDVPMGWPDAEVVIMIRPVPLTTVETPLLDWPPDFFAQTFGCLRDEPLVREVQSEYEVREVLL